jgi:hypothetical protein
VNHSRDSGDLALGRGIPPHRRIFPLVITQAGGPARLFAAGPPRSLPKRPSGFRCMFVMDLFQLTATGEW